MLTPVSARRLALALLACAGALAFASAADTPTAPPSPPSPTSRAQPAAPAVTPTSLPGAETFIYRDAAAGAEPMRLHVFKPQDWAAGDRRPALVHFFGGGFLRGTPQNSAGWARTAARWGMVGVAPDYRTKERFGTDGRACVADARAALRWVQTHADELGIDPARIVVSGSSAGGHLALWTATAATPPGSDPAEAPLRPPAALVLLSAAADTTATSGERNDRFGGEGDALSPLHHLDPAMPPVLLFHGDADTVVKFSIAEALARALRERGGVCEFVVIPGGGHAFTNDSPGWKEKTPELIRAFLVRQTILPLPAP